MDFQLHTVDTAPPGSRPVLQAVKERYGFIPNLAAVFAESPGTFNALLGVLKAYDDEALTLSLLERQVVLLSVSVENRCDYCTAAHSLLAHSLGLSRENVDALQTGEPLDDTRLEALRRFATRVVADRGVIKESSLQAFIDAGFTKGQVLEVVLGVSLKTLTNYANHIANPPVNDQFKAFLPSWAAAA